MGLFDEALGKTSGGKPSASPSTTPPPTARSGSGLFDEALGRSSASPAPTSSPKQPSPSNDWKGRVERAASNGFSGLGDTLNNMIGGGYIKRQAEAYTAGQTVGDRDKARNDDLKQTVSALRNKSKAKREDFLKKSQSMDQVKGPDPFKDTLDYYAPKDTGTATERFLKNLPEDVNVGISVGQMMAGSPIAQASLGATSSALTDIAGNRKINWKNVLVQGVSGYAFGKLSHGTGAASEANAAARVAGEEISPGMKFIGSKIGGAATRVAGSSLIQGTASGVEAKWNHTGKFGDGFKEGAIQGAEFGLSFEAGQSIAPHISNAVGKIEGKFRDYQPHYAPGFIKLWGDLKPEFDKHVLDGVDDPAVKGDLEKKLSNFKDKPGISKDWKDAMATQGVKGINKLEKAGIFSSPEKSAGLVSKIVKKNITPSLEKWVSDEVSVIDPAGKNLEKAISKIVSDPKLASQAPKLQKLIDSEFGIVHKSAELLQDVRPKTAPESMQEIASIKNEIRAQHGEEGLRALYQEVGLHKTPTEQLPDWYKARIKSENIKQKNTTPQDAIGDTPGENKIAPHAAGSDLIVNTTKNPKATAMEFRTAYSEVENRLIGEAAQVSEKMKKLAKKEMNAVDWHIDAKGDRALLEQWANDPALKAHHDDILQAMHLSENGMKAVELAREYYDKVGEHQKDLGIIGDVRDNYSNRIIKKGPKVSGVEGTSGLKRGMRQSKSRVYDTKAEGIKNGVDYATHNAADLLQEYGKDYARFSAQRQLVGTLEHVNLGNWVDRNNIPEGWKTMDGMQRDVPLKTDDGKMVIGKDGNQMVLHHVFAVPDYMERGLRAITEKPVREEGPLQKLKAYQAVVKSVELSLSFFHHLTLTAQTIYQTNFGLKLPSLIKYWTSNSGSHYEMEQNFLDHGGITTVVDKNYDVLRKAFGETGFMDKIENVPGLKHVKQALELPGKLMDKNHDFLFGHIQRWAKVSDFSKKLESWKSQNPKATPLEVKTAGRGYAREINAAYGGLNWKALGITPSMQRSMRFLLLAPDWTYSNVELAKLGFGDWGKGMNKPSGEGTGGAAARAHFISALIGSSIMTETLNKMLTGHYTNDNAKGHEMELEIRPGVYVSLFRGGVGDGLKLVSNVMEESNKATADGTTGPVVGTVRGSSRFLQGKLSPLARTGVEALTQTDFYGNPLLDPKKSTAENTKNELVSLGVSSLPIPFGVQPTIKEAKTGDKVGTALVATGIGRPGQTKEQSDANQIYQDNTATTNKNTFENKTIEKKIEAGDMSVLKGISKKRADALKKAANKDQMVQSLPKGSKLRELMYDSKKQLLDYAKAHPEDADTVKQVQGLQLRLKNRRG